MSTRLGFAAVAAGLALSGSAKHPTPIVVSAFADSAGLRFDPPTPLPWASWLPAHLRLSRLVADSVTRRELFARRSDFGSTEVGFTVPTPRDIEKRFYYLLDPSGPREIRPTGLIGTARIKWGASAAEVRALESFGQVMAAVGRSSLGGFVLASETPMTLTIERSQMTADELLAPAGGSYFGRGTPFREIVAQYRVRETAPKSERWVWVQWKPDRDMVEAGCERRFSLFRLDPQPTEVGATDDHCDV